jgi:predicted SAM-dependent methyltransferase
MPEFLHVGCGSHRAASTTIGVRHPDWREIRLDIDPACEPDLLGSIIDMPAVASASVDAVYSSHNIEHVYPHEVGPALAEFRRVLKPDGFLVLTCPDLQAIAERVANDQLTEALSPECELAAMDVIFGDRVAMASGEMYMAHHCGFTAKVLHMSLFMAGFRSIRVHRRPLPYFDLWAVAMLERAPVERMDRLLRLYVPPLAPMLAGD